MKKIVFPGSFDPITIGHLDIIKRASLEYDEVIVLVANNENKDYMFTLDERYNFVLESIKNLPNVKVAKTNGFTTDFLEENGLDTILRSYRDNADLEYEKTLGTAYQVLMPDIKIIYYQANEKFANISSTLVRRMILEGLDPSQYLPFKLKMA